MVSEARLKAELDLKDAIYDLADFLANRCMVVRSRRVAFDHDDEARTWQRFRAAHEVAMGERTTG